MLVCVSGWSDGVAGKEKRDRDGADGRGEISEKRITVRQTIIALIKSVHPFCPRGSQDIVEQG